MIKSKSLTKKKRIKKTPEIEERKKDYSKRHNEIQK